MYLVQGESSNEYLRDGFAMLYLRVKDYFPSRDPTSAQTSSARPQQNMWVEAITAGSWLIAHQDASEETHVFDGFGASTAYRPVETLVCQCMQQCRYAAKLLQKGM